MRLGKNYRTTYTILTGRSPDQAVSLSEYVAKTGSANHCPVVREGDVAAALKVPTPLAVDLLTYIEQLWGQ